MQDRFIIIIIIIIIITLIVSEKNMQNITA